MSDVRKSPEVLVYNLCALLSKNQSKETTSKLTQYALRMFSAYGQDSVPNIDETSLVEKLKMQFSKKNQMDDAVKISVLHRRLKQCHYLENRWSILYLLYALSNHNDQKKISGGTMLFRQGLATSSTPANVSLDSPVIAGDSITSSSGIGTAGLASSRGTLDTPSQLPSGIAMPGDQTSLGSTRLTSRLGWTLTPSSNSSAQRSTQIKQKSTPFQAQTNEVSVSRVPASISRSTGSSKEQVNEATLVRQLLYVFQGIPTQNIKYSEKDTAFAVDTEVSVDKRNRQTVNKLCELGWLHNHVKKYIAAHNKDKAFGLVGQAFCAALQHELTEYYRLLSVLQSQIQQIDAGFEESCALTLSKLKVWTSEPLERLVWAASLVDNCRDKRGGALASMVYAFMQIGDTQSRSMTRRILNVVAQPLFNMVKRWIYDGELHDPFHEFFIAADLAVSNDRLWYDKYKMRSSMVPSFIKSEEAEKILLVGKSINFLRLVCRDRTDIPMKDRPKTFTEQSFDQQGYSLDFASELKEYVDHAYEVTSCHLLQVLNERYKLLTHLHALRKFLLLGQGDFIRHLLDLLQEELSKPANLLYRHNLSGPVEAAVRASNAQFEDQDVLTRLDFRLLEINPGDCGWDVFSLDYHVDQPLNTLITPDVMLVYLRIFIFLWRAKRMEYNLASIWTGSMEQSRKLTPRLPQLQGVLHKGHALAAEMVHFVHQMQYYIAFEVLECSWADLQAKLEKAKDFDEIISAHHSFLQSLMKRCLLDQSSSNLLTQLRTIFDQIVKFEHLQREIYEQSIFEMEARQKYDDAIEDAKKKGVWGADVEKEGQELSRRREFRKVAIPEMRARLKVCACSYQDMVVMFLQQLAKESDANLRNLSWRLDFNEHYKERNSVLRVAPLNSARQPVGAR